MIKSLFFKVLLPAFVVASVFIYGYVEYQRFLHEPLKIEDEGLIYELRPGMNVKSLSLDLQARDLSDLHPLYLQIYGRLTEQSHRIKAGEYRIEAGTTLPQLLQQLVEGKVVQYALTIIEGMTAQQLVDALSTHPRIVNTLPENRVEAAMAALGEADMHGEGWFLPETYHFPAGTTDIEFLRRARNKMQRALEAAWENRAPDLPYDNPYEALVMASIIEKETGVPEERAEIAGVFVRRMKLGMRLQTDPTVIYGMGEAFDGNLRKKDLTTDTPYNTYTRGGLPPTPICLPGIESIHAALHPADGDSLYFVSTGDGRHVFSSNLADHNRAVRRYQLGQ